MDAKYIWIGYLLLALQAHHIMLAASRSYGNSIMDFETTQPDWQSFVDNQLSAFPSAAIFNQAGNVWGQSTGFGQLQPGEFSAILKGFSEPDSLFSTGLSIGGIRYGVIHANGVLIHGKKGAAGVILEKTAQTIIIGFYDAILPPAVAAAIIGKLADYFLENGY